MDVRPLSGVTGAEVQIPVRLNQADSDTLREICKVASERCVVVLREQFLTAQELAQVGASIGTLTENPTVQRLKDRFPDLPEHVSPLVNPGPDKAFYTETWHTDSPNLQPPPAFTILSAATIPAVGGDTLFLNQYASYERLSDGFKDIIRGRQLLHTCRGMAPQKRPLVRVHPVTGARALYINAPEIVDAIDGFSVEESKLIIQHLYAHSICINRMYRHRWRPGDVVMWDNRCTLHAAAYDYGDAERTLFRVMTEGELPVAPQ